MITYGTYQLMRDCRTMTESADHIPGLQLSFCDLGQDIPGVVSLGDTYLKVRQVLTWDGRGVAEFVGGRDGLGKRELGGQECLQAFTLTPRTFLP